MSIINSINKGREKGIKDKDILEEIIKQNPDKKNNFEQALKRGATHSQILEEIIKQNQQEKKEDSEQKQSQEQEKSFPEKKNNQEQAQNLIMQKVKKQESTSTNEKIKEKPLPPKKTATEKQWVRLIIFLILFLTLIGFGTFWVWFLIIRDTSEVNLEPEKYNTQKECQEAGFYWHEDACRTQEPEPEPDTEPKLNAGDYTEEQECQEVGFYWYEDACHEQELELKINLEEAQELISNKLAEEREIGFFEEIKFEKQGQEIEFTKIINALEINFPELFNQLIEPSFFVYSQEQGDRLGFYAKTEKNLEDLLEEKEPDLLNIFENLFVAMDFNQQPVSNVFKNSTDYEPYQGPNFRYQSLNREDLGIIYYISDDYFIFSSSWESIEEILTQELIFEL